MITLSGLPPEVEAVGLAIGLLEPTPDGELLVVEGFFREPLRKLGHLVSDPHQRAALVDMLALWLPEAPPALTEGLPEGWVRACHPLLEPGRAGQLYVIV